MPKGMSRGSGTTYMGIDPGLGTTGWAVICHHGDTSQLIAYGAIRTRPSMPMAERLLTICEKIREVVNEHVPAEVAVEDIFMAKDARAAFALGQARGAAIVGAALAGRDVQTYTALQVKKSVTGNGQAAKDQVGYMVQRLLGLHEPIHPADAADAAAVAICHSVNCRSLVEAVVE